MHICNVLQVQMTCRKSASVVFVLAHPPTPCVHSIYLSFIHSMVNTRRRCHRHFHFAINFISFVAVCYHIQCTRHIPSFGTCACLRFIVKTRMRVATIFRVQNYHRIVRCRAFFPLSHIPLPQNTCKDAHIQRTAHRHTHTMNLFAIYCQFWSRFTRTDMATFSIRVRYRCRM